MKTFIITMNILVNDEFDDDGYRYPRYKGMSKEEVLQIKIQNIIEGHRTKADILRWIYDWRNYLKMHSYNLKFPYQHTFREVSKPPIK